MPKANKRIRRNEDRSKNLHADMNMRVGPTRLEPFQNIPTYVMIDIDPIIRQVNRLEERTIRNERLYQRRAWRNGL